jgi:hypothetical protein
MCDLALVAIDHQFAGNSNDAFDLAYDQLVAGENGIPAVGNWRRVTTIFQLVTLTGNGVGDLTG